MRGLSLVGGKRGPLFIAVRGPLTIAASLVAEHRLQMCRLSNCGSRAQLLRGMRDLPRPGLEPVSPALAGRFSTTAPPGKPLSHFYGPDFYFFLISSKLVKYKELMKLVCWFMFLSILSCLFETFQNFWKTRNKKL